MGLLIRNPANQVDEQSDRIGVADAFGISALSLWLLLPLFPVRNDESVGMTAKEGCSRMVSLHDS